MSVIQPRIISQYRLIPTWQFPRAIERSLLADRNVRIKQGPVSTTLTRRFQTRQLSTEERGPEILESLPRRHFYLRNAQSMRQRASQAIFLRDSCTCPLCINESTRQRKFNTYEIPRTLEFRDCIRDGSSIKIYWKNDIPGYDENHCTTISEDYFWKLQGSRTLQKILRRRKSWHAPGFEPHEVAFDEYTYNEQRFSVAMRHLYTDGILFVTGVPDQEHSVKAVASKIGPLRNTFYGSTWNVVSQQDAKNVAYTSEKLDFHMDLMYMSKPPSFQLLHCMDNSLLGGSSRFVDTFAAAQILKDRYPVFYEKLAGSPMTFHYQNGPHHYLRQAPTLEPLTHKVMGQYPVRLSEVGPDLFSEELAKPDSFDRRRTYKRRRAGRDAARDYLQGYYISELKAVNWAPPFQGPLGNSIPKLPIFVGALAKFRDIMEIAEISYKRKMQPGECVIFDNRRIAHARSAFRKQSTGSRKLRGAYLDDDDFLSKCEDLWTRDREIWQEAVDFDDAPEWFFDQLDDRREQSPVSDTYQVHESGTNSSWKEDLESSDEDSSLATPTHSEGGFSIANDPESRGFP